MDRLKDGGRNGGRVYISYNFSRTEDRVRQKEWEGRAQENNIKEGRENAEREGKEMRRRSRITGEMERNARGEGGKEREGTRMPPLLSHYPIVSIRASAQPRPQLGSVPAVFSDQSKGERDKVLRLLIPLTSSFRINKDNFILKLMEV